MHTHDPAFVTAALERAVKAIGVPEVAKRLNAPAALVRDWMNRHVAMPDRKVMELIAILGEIDEAPGGRQAR